MVCKNPYMLGSQPCPCGQCMPCRISKRKVWAYRMLLESMKHGDSSFLTLTYDDEHLPEGGTLVPEDTQKWLKRFRKAIEPHKFRYYLVGEYGDSTHRPHYHAALFGISTSFRDVIESTWAKGHIMLGELTHASANYIAGYVTKKMTSPDDPRLEGRYPEFARMSNRPGIGATAMQDIADSLISPHGEILGLSENGDVPMSLKIGGKTMPLGRYLREQLRKKVGISDEAKEKELQKWSQELSALFQTEILHAKNGAKSFKKILTDKNKQKIRNIESKAKIYKQNKTL